ncbi:MAG: Xylose isomerase domain protein barrel [Gemmatimonadetes bacterium]|nr:Xylose isomerase domain protein barrel [Gemmatimonadota bacterium]
MTSRRDFLAASAAAMTMPWWNPSAGAAGQAARAGAPLFRISLAQWSLHKELFAKRLDHLDFAKVARQEFGLEAIEYVNVFFKTRARDAAYLAEMNRRAADHGVYQHLIMVDGEGDLGDPDPGLRARAVENHLRWVEAAKDLGCATIRVNANSKGTFEEQQQLVVDGLRRLCELAAPLGINVIVENHGGLASRADWLVGVIRLVDHPRCGTAQGNETTKDFRRLMKTVLDAGFRGWIGIEYEGDRLPEREGIRRTLQLLERIRTEMSS